jgi:hypothetical protein
MAAKKKTKKKKSPAKKVTRKKLKPAKKPAARKAAPKRKVAKKKTAKKPAPKKQAARKKPAPAKSASAPKKPARSASSIDNVVSFSRESARARKAGQSGDLQGLPRAQSADSESVDELLEEGNTFEAEAVAGVEAAGNAEGQEVHTHEVPTDDVPDEYLDKD